MNARAIAYSASDAETEKETSIFMKTLASTLLNQAQGSSSVWLEENAASAAMIEALVARGPLPGLSDKLSLFGQFVGSWDLKITNYPEVDKPEHATGEWHFGWALEGRAIMDVWISPKREDRGKVRDLHGDYGVTVRIFDPELDAWRSTWIGPRKSLVRPFVARLVGNEIVLSGNFKPGVETRWVFSKITRESYHWRSEESSDGWKTLRLWQTMEATRR